MSDIQGSGTMSDAFSAGSMSATANNSNSTALTSPQELLNFPIRALHKVESFAFYTLPKNIIRYSGLEDMAVRVWSGDLFADDATTTQGASSAGAAVRGGGGGGGGAAAGGGGGGATGTDESGINFGDVFETVRKFGGFFSYIASRWSYACFVVVSGFVLLFSTYFTLKSNSNCSFFFIML